MSGPPPELWLSQAEFHLDVCLSQPCQLGPQGLAHPTRLPKLQLPLLPTWSKACGPWVATKPEQRILDVRNHFRGSVLEVFCPVIVSGAGSLTLVNEVSLERCPAQAWALDEQTEPRTDSTVRGAKPTRTPPISRPVDRGNCSRGKWQQAVSGDIRSSSIETFVTKKIC